MKANEETVSKHQEIASQLNMHRSLCNTAIRAFNVAMEEAYKAVQLAMDNYQETTEDAEEFCIALEAEVSEVANDKATSWEESEDLRIWADNLDDGCHDLLWGDSLQAKPCNLEEISSSLSSFIELPMQSPEHKEQEEVGILVA